MEWIIQLDTALFLFFNKTLANGFFDVIMPFITESDHWRIPIALIVLGLLIFGGRKGRWVVLLVIIIITLSDQLSSHVVKPWIGRTRPCFVVEDVRQLIRQSRSFSFPSSHAANMSAMAFLFSWKYPKGTWIFIAIALTVGYSRIYVGVHYPFDVVFGFMLGSACAAVVLIMESRIRRVWKKHQKKTYSEDDAGPAAD
ncbi:MAG TPA: phosphatase PAP2 family protein [bacterium]|nr:phosphatase PAP2 family protein [bacterium]